MVSKFKTKYLDNSDNPYFISEIGINHNGILSLALQMIRESKKAGFNAVKFQKRNANDLLNFGLKTKKPIGYLSKNKNDIPKKSVNFGKWVYPDTRLELKDKDYKKIKSYCKSIKIDLIITPWDEKSMDFVENIGVKAVKVASIDANNFHFCNYIAKKRLPTIISTGMCTYDELKKTKKIFQKYKTPHMFLHCTSAYPSEEKDKNLLCIPELKRILKTEIGFSGHGKGMAGSVGAVALGATVIEKHSTLNKHMAGPDHAASLELDVLKNMIDLAKKVKTSLGKPIKKLHKSERILHSILSRKIVAREKIKKGQTFTFKNIKPVLVYKNYGLKTNEVLKIINKSAKRNIVKGEIITIRDI
jgi:sialic acid synthase SpsE